MIKKVENTVPWTHGINDLNGEKIVGTFYKKELQKKSKRVQNWKNNEEKKVINYMLNGKDTIIRLIAG